MSNSAAQRRQGDLYHAAWILAFGDGLHAAISETEMLHLSAELELFEIPGSPFYCRHVCIWNDQLVPVMDVSAWLTGRNLAHEQLLVGIVRYERWPTPGSTNAPVQLGGFLLSRLPKRVNVGEDQACGLPETELNWQEISISCFSDEASGAIPILDLPRIFSDALALQAENHSTVSLA